jgi:molybdate transport system regulatory protein
MRAGNRTVGARLRIVVAPGVAIGPGKAALLEGIKETGSISAAARRLAMSYKRAWYLVETLNGHFGKPLVVSVKGGRAGGGAQLTPLGEEVLAAFREMERLSEAAIAPLMKRLRRKAGSL